MKPEFVVERQGKSFVLYAGLLDQAHSEGLRRINTLLIQAPDENNALTAIASAEVETTKGTFSGIGDASPANVTQPMVACLIRMAETRAKARALRDAINVGTCSLEELGEDAATDQPEQPKPTRRPAPRQAEPTEPKPPANGNGNGRASERQVSAIYALGKKAGLPVERVEALCIEAYNRAPEALTKAEASSLIGQFQAEQLN